MAVIVTGMSGMVDAFWVTGEWSVSQSKVWIDVDPESSGLGRSWQDGGRILARDMEPDQTHLLLSYIQDQVGHKTWIVSQWGRMPTDRFSLSLWCHSCVIAGTTTDPSPPSTTRWRSKAPCALNQSWLLSRNSPNSTSLLFQNVPNRLESLGARSASWPGPVNQEIRAVGFLPGNGWESPVVRQWL